MTHEIFISYLKNPEQVSEKSIPELKELCEKYPYFDVARMLYLKALHKVESIYYEDELNKTALYVKTRKKLYYFIYPEKESRKTERNKAGSYFEVMEQWEKKNDGQQSLKELAEKLKTARENLLEN